MPIIKSAKKRVRVSKANTKRNLKIKQNYKSAVKAFRSSLGSKTASEKLSKAQSTLDTAVKQGLMHKNKAARLKKRLAKQAKDQGVKLSTGKKSPAKSAKKSTPKTTAKKTTAKKAATAKSKTTKPKKS